MTHLLFTWTSNGGLGGLAFGESIPVGVAALAFAFRRKDRS